MPRAANPGTKEWALTRPSALRPSSRTAVASWSQLIKPDQESKGEEKGEEKEEASPEPEVRDEKWWLAKEQSILVESMCETVIPKLIQV